MIGCAETQAGRFLVTMDRDRKGRIFMKFEPWGWKINNNLQVLSRIRKIKKAGTNQHILVGDVNLMGYLFQMELTLQKLAKTKRKCFRIRFKEVF